MREDNANFVVDVLLELLGRERRDVPLRGAVLLQVAVRAQVAILLRSVILAGSVTLFKQLGVNLARPVGVGDCSRVRGQLTVDGIGFLVICQALLYN